MLDWMKHKLESRLPGEMSITSDQMTPEVKKNQRASGESKEESEKVGLNSTFRKLRS